MLEDHRGQEEPLHPLAGDQLPEGVGIAAHLLAQQQQAAAGAEGGEDLLPGDIKHTGGELQHPGGAAEAGMALVPADQVFECPLGHGHRLGSAGGAGGVEHHRQVVGVRGAGGVGGVPQSRWPQALQGGAIEAEDHAGPGTELLAVRGRPAGIEGHHRRAGLEHRQQGDHQLQGTLQLERHDLLAAHAAGQQGVGQAIGPAIEFGVAQPGALKAHGRRLGGAPHLAFHQRRQPTALQGHQRPLLPGPDPGPLRGRQAIEAGHRRLRRPQHGRQQRLQLLQQPRDPIGVEQVAGVDQGALQPALIGAAPEELQIKAGRQHRRPQALDPQALEPRQRGCLHFNELQQHLRQRVAAHLPLRGRQLDHLLKGQVLVIQGRQRGGRHLAEQLLEARLAIDPQRDRQGVDEEADQVLQGRMGAPQAGDRDGDALLTTGALQQHPHQRQEPHLQMGALLLAELLEGGPLLRRDGEPLPRPPQAGVDGPGAVGGEGEGFEVLQLLAPVVGQPLLLGALQALALPVGKVVIVQGKRRQGGGAAGAAGVVERREIAHQHPARPAVEGDVVDGEPQQMLPPPHRQQPAPHELARLEVQGGGVLLLGPALQHGLAPAGAEGLALELERGGGMQALQHRIALQHEGGAQGGMAGDQIA